MSDRRQLISRVPAALRAGVRAFEQDRSSRVVHVYEDDRARREDRYFGETAEDARRRRSGADDAPDDPPPLPHDWPARWELGFTWERLGWAIALSFPINIALAIADVGHERTAHLYPPFLAWLWINALGRKASRRWLPQPDRRKLPPLAALFEVVAIAVLTVPLVAVQIVGDRRDGWWLAAAGVIAVALVLVRPAMSWAAFAAFPPRAEDAETDLTIGGALFLTVVAAAALAVLWWLVSDIYVMDAGDRSFARWFGVALFAVSVIALMVGVWRTRRRERARGSRDRQLSDDRA